MTGSDGAMRETALLTVVKLTRTSGGGVRLAVDYNRVEKAQGKVRILEVCTTAAGKFAKLHSLSFAQTPEEYKSKLDEEITRQFVLKGVASDVLRSAWAGDDWKRTVERVTRPEQIQECMKDTIVQKMGEKPDEEALRLYYVLHSVCPELRRKLVRENNGYVLLVPPIAHVYTPDDKVIDVEKIVNSEWVFGIRRYQNVEDFRRVAEQNGEILE